MTTYCVTLEMTSSQEPQFPHLSGWNKAYLSWLLWKLELRNYIISLASHGNSTEMNMINVYSMTLSLLRSFKPLAIENRWTFKPLSNPTLHAQVTRHLPKRPRLITSNAVWHFFFFQCAAQQVRPLLRGQICYHSWLTHSILCLALGWQPRPLSLFFQEAITISFQ